MIDQMDVVTAFWNEILDEEIHMEQPLGYIKEGQEYLVWKLKCFLYGLKTQHMYTIYNTKSIVFICIHLDGLIESMNFKQCTTDPYIFVRSEGSIIDCSIC